MELELQQFTINNKRLAQELDDCKMQLENELLVYTYIYLFLFCFNDFK
jgi:hypothetical protein